MTNFSSLVMPVPRAEVCVIVVMGVRPSILEIQEGRRPSEVADTTPHRRYSWLVFVSVRLWSYVESLTTAASYLNAVHNCGRNRDGYGERCCGPAARVFRT